jgi:hypothetical protein
MSLASVKTVVEEVPTLGKIERWSVRTWPSMVSDRLPTETEDHGTKSLVSRFQRAASDGSRHADG